MPQEGKSDMERIGLFKEMGYISTGDKYVPFVYRPFNESAYKNKQILSSVPKKKCGLQVGYFESQYRRIFEGEAFADPGKLRRQYKMQQAKRNVGKAFLASSGEQRPSGAGSYYGTLSGPVKAMSALQIARKPYKAPGKNFVTNPPKKGSGYGYPNVTLSKLESYSADPYDRTREILKREMRAHRSLMKGPAFHFNLHPMEYFDNNPYKADRPLPPMKNPEKIKASLVPFRPSSPGKRIGGMKAGTFEAYPSHSADAYGLKTSRAASVKKDGKVFHPSSGPKSMPVKSILDMNVLRTCIKL